MKRLADVCRQITTDLEHLVVEIEALQADLTSFEERAARWPIEQVAQRLRARADGIKEEASRLLSEHGGQGCIVISIGDNGIGFIRWVENREIMADKEHFRARGMAVFFVKEILDLIEYLTMELGRGNWDEAVTFLKNHTICIEKDGRYQPLE